MSCYSQGLICVYCMLCYSQSLICVCAAACGRGLQHQPKSSLCAIQRTAHIPVWPALLLVSPEHHHLTCNQSQPMNGACWHLAQTSLNTLLVWLQGNAARSKPADLLLLKWLSILLWLLLSGLWLPTFSHASSQQAGWADCCYCHCESVRDVLYLTLHQACKLAGLTLITLCRSYLILRIAYKQVRSGVTEDIREED